ncbi:hypothetical protein ACFS5N_02080 [Mucilaginibacter ximonensis]|uniref:DUF3592 domain-containing protein n=1 Tax=Mucilaginibacter ximonensis TaxID=538021 RepID=A0ABW5Y7H5_9SPHI
MLITYLYFMNPEPEQQPHKRLKDSLTIVLVLLLGFSFFTPRAVGYSDITIIRAIPFLINFIAIPTIAVALLRLKKGVFKGIFILYGFLIYITVSIVSASIDYSSSSNDLKADGVPAKAIISAVKPRTTTFQHYWQIYFTYRANNRSYDARFRRDKKPAYKAGDTLELIYDKDFPRMYRLTKIY